MNKIQIEETLNEMGQKPSISEEKGLGLIGLAPQKILSVGISSGGFSEIKMAKLNPKNKIIATTIDESGLKAVEENIEKLGLSDQIETKIEDVSSDWKYPDNEFDFIYARLVLHYLLNQDIEMALQNIERTLEKGGIFFSVVHSVESPKKYPAYREAKYNEKTGHTTIPFYEKDGRVKHDYMRRFYNLSEYQKLIESNGFKVTEMKEFDELLYHDFMRTIPAEFGEDTLIWCVAEKC